MKKLIVILIIVLVIAGGIFAFYMLSNPEKNGEYFDENQNLLGTCTKEYVKASDGYGGTYYYKFYDLKGNLLGTCSEYSGPGASGWKGGCDEDSAKNNVGTRIEEGQYAGRIAQKYECINRSLK